MTKYTGSALVIKFGTQVVNGQGRTFEVNQSTDEIDVTGYGSTGKEFILGLPDRDASSEILDDSATTTIRSKLQIGTVDSLTWFPIGTASGNPKFTCSSALVKEANLSYPYDDAVLLSVNFRLSGAVTESTAP